MASPALSLRDCGLTLGSTVCAPPTTLEAPAGTLTALTGPNGSGKTTLLRIAAGRVPEHGGSASVFGAAPDSRSTEFRRTVCDGIDPVDTASDLTVGENIVMVSLAWNGVSDLRDLPTAPVMLELGVDAFLDRFPHELSSGQRQMLTLSMLLARPSRLMLLDEPERHLDHERRLILARALRSLAAGGPAVVVSTHSREILEAADQTVTLEAHRPRADPDHDDDGLAQPGSEIGDAAP